MANYIALIRKDRKTCFGVDFPDFPGCIAAGDTLEEARANAEAGLALHVEYMIEKGEAIPEPSALDAVMAKPEHRDGVATLIPLRLGKGRAVRINITVDERLLKELDAEAAHRGESRSGFIASCVRATIASAVPAAARASRKVRQTHGPRSRLRRP